MPKTIEALVEEDGSVRLSEPVQLKQGTKVLVTLSEPFDSVSEDDRLASALLSEASLAVDWDRPEEEEAWAYLQQDP